MIPAVPVRRSQIITALLTVLSAADSHDPSKSQFSLKINSALLLVLQSLFSHWPPCLVTLPPSLPLPPPSLSQTRLVSINLNHYKQPNLVIFIQYNTFKK